MNQSQIKSLIQFLGLASLVFGLYSVYSQYQVVVDANAAANSVAQGLGASGTENLVREMADAAGYGWQDLLLRSPWVWAGVILIIAPYVIGLGRGTYGNSANQFTSTQAQPVATS